MSNPEIVELGLPDGSLTVQDEEAFDLFTSKIGGFPVYAKPELVVQEPKCACCGSTMYLIIQMDAPLPDTPTHDRIFYAFACNSAKCAATPNGWCAFFTLVSKSSSPRDEATAPSALLKKNFWDTDYTPEESLSKLSIKDDDEAEYVAVSSYSAQLPATALRIVEEFWQEARKKPEPVVVVEPLPEPAGTEEADVYENIMPTGVDKQFQTFQKRTAAYPRQCVRYSPGGQALPFNASPLPQTSPVCPNCQQPQHFELQLMPAILNYLPVSNAKYLGHIPPEKRSNHPLFGDEMQWGTVIVYSCGIGCHVLGGGNNAHVPATCHIQLE